jgi:UDP-2-acetamido-3-amino-2,3-dideoxy-glucuronate N-acetyltransferase
MSKIAVIGAGKWGKNHVKTLYNMGQLAAIIEANETIRNSFKENYPEIPTFSTIDEKGALDFLGYTIAAPAVYHFELAKTLLEHNKHILVEKPITLCSKEAALLNKIAKERKLVITTGHLLLFHPAFREMKACIKEGKLGNIQYIYSNRLNLGTIRTKENSLWSFAPHDISLFQYLTESYPTHIHSEGGAFIQPHIHDTTLTTIKYPNNITSHIFVSWLHPFKEHRFVLIGSKGMLTFEDSSKDKQLLFYQKGVDWVNGEPIKREGPTETITYEEAQPLTLEMQHFIDCIEGKVVNNLINGEKGQEVLEILEKADASLHSKEPETKLSNPVDNKYPNVKIHESAYVDNNTTIGKNSKIWHFSHIQNNVNIGESCIIGQNVNIANNVTIGNFCKIQNNVSVYEGVEIEDYVFCGPSMVFTNIINPRCKYPQAESQHYKKTRIKTGASIGANATIVCGITIGAHALIGAGSVVTKDVPNYAIITGNPGRISGWMSEGGIKLNFNEKNEAYCKKSKKSYTKKGDIVIEQERILNHAN